MLQNAATPSVFHAPPPLAQGRPGLGYGTHYHGSNQIAHFNRGRLMVFAMWATDAREDDGMLGYSRNGEKDVDGISEF